MADRKNPAEEPIELLKAKLRELFQMERGDLDFGLYRIMSFVRGEVAQFIDNDLLPQAGEYMETLALNDRARIRKEIEEMSEAATRMGHDPKTTPKIQELKQELAEAKIDEQTEIGVYNHLYNFFARYYNNGDFMSLRRYKAEGKEAYMVPYNGEEVKLHWANADQYYIKTAENYASYIFTVGTKQQRVRFEIAAADAEKDNVKAVNGKGRHFVLAKKDAAEESGNDLIIRFEHRPLTDAEKQQTRGNGGINNHTEEQLHKKLAQIKNQDWARWLKQTAPTAANGERTLLRKHLDTYTAKNEFDYFIHKDLGGFLRRELDSYIKNEVLSLDDWMLKDSRRAVKRTLVAMSAIRFVGGKIIDFVAQLENFQKQLWLKKKFVLASHYCVTLDRVPEHLLGEIAKNKAQHNEWLALFAIDEIGGDLVGCAYSKPLKKEFLMENPHLVVDTKHFSQKFTDELLTALSEAAPLDEQTDGLLVHGENFQALNLLQARYSGQAECIYIDPPYNTAASLILYKNDYKHSSWLSLIENRLSLAKEILREKGVLCCAIDDEESWRLREIMAGIFAVELGIVAVRSNPAGRKTKGRFAPAHEYALFYGKTTASIPAPLEKTEAQIKSYPHEDDIGRFMWTNLVRSGTNDRREDSPTLFYPIFIGKNNQFRIPDMEWNGDADEWVLLENPTDSETAMYPYRTVQGKRVDGNWHRGPKRLVGDDPSEYRVRKDKNGKIVFEFKKRMDEHSLPKTWWDEGKYSTAQGTIALSRLFGSKDFDFPKSVDLVKNCLQSSMNGNTDALVLDFFAGSGTTGHAVVSLNRADNGKRKYALIEVGRHFDGVLLPRIKKVIYSDSWKDGKPVAHKKGISQLFRYVRLESYEDTMDSLDVREGKKGLEGNLKESYYLRYLLQSGTEHNAALVGATEFTDPFAYKISVVRDGIRQDTAVDLPETFNFLLGLRVTARRYVGDVLVIRGTCRKKQNCLVLWRNTKKIGAKKLNAWFKKHAASLTDGINTIYVNGDQMLSAKNDKATYNVVATEPTLKQLMFESKDQ